MNNNKFANETVVITGAGTGYGRALSIALLNSGANVVLIGRRKEKLVETINIVKNINSNNYLIASCDITDIQSIENTINKIKNKFESVDILLNCAALAAKKNAKLSSITEKRWDDMIDTNLKAQWIITKEVFKLMHNKIARVLFFTSGAGWANTNGYGLYNVSKAALNSLTISMAEEYRENYPTKIISINGINPGEANTEMNSGSKIEASVICEMVLKIISTKKNIPNGHFFHRNGNSIRFCDSREYQYVLE